MMETIGEDSGGLNYLMAGHGVGPRKTVTAKGNNGSYQPIFSLKPMFLATKKRL